MKKIIYLLCFAMLLLACKKQELPGANFNLAQVEDLDVHVDGEVVKLEWSSPQEFFPKGYRIEWVTANSGIQGGEMIVDASVNSVEIDQLAHDVVYTFSVQAKYDDGLSQKVSETAVPKNDKIQVSNFVALAGDTRAKLSWTKPNSTKIEGYQITVNPGNQTYEVSDPSLENFFISNLTNGMEYTFSIVAVYARGNSVPVSMKTTPGEVDPVITASKNIIVNYPTKFEYNDLFFAKDIVASIQWDFGNGNIYNDPVVMHSYTEQGVYKIKVTATYEDGTSESADFMVNVIGSMWSETALNKNGLTGYVKVSNPVFSPDLNTMYIPTSSPNGHLFAIDVRSGAINWVFNITELTYGGGAVVGPDGTIYQGSDNAIYAINPDGSQKWKVASEGAGALARVRAFPALSSNGTLFVLSNSALYAITSNSGLVKWKNSIAGSVGSAVLAGKDGTVYIGTDQGIFAFNGETGVQKWSVPDLNVTESGSMAMHGDAIFATLKAGKGLVSINKSTGSVRWTFDPVDGDAYLPVIDKNGDIYFSEKATVPNVFVYAIKSNGTLKWKKAIQSSMNYVGLVIGDNGVIYCGTNAAIGGSRKIYGLNLSDGEVAYEQSNPNNIQSALTIGPDRRLYVGVIGASNIGSIFAYSINAGLEVGSWSLRGGNWQGTNQEK